MNQSQNKDIKEKLKILAAAAKFDVSCASSGINKKNAGGLGNAKDFGICHSWSADGRCVSLLKILLTNDCIYNCSYCLNRSGNDVPRASFTAEEVVDLTVEFYRRNYIEGLFLSSAVAISPDHTMEKIVRALTLLRRQHKFFGYIHVKVIPGASQSLISQAGLLADRMSVNLELATPQSLALLAPQKSLTQLLTPMNQINQEIVHKQEEYRRFRHAPRYAPAGQSTQLIIGAAPDNDLAVLRTTEKLYEKFALKRVYFSAYIPVNTNPNLPSLLTAPPLLREHRLYQADWLLRFYQFKREEIVNEAYPSLDPELDPKISWALRNINYFPLEINQASYEELIRVPGIGVTSALRIIKERRLAPLAYEQLGKTGAVLKRAKYFITCRGKYHGGIPLHPDMIRNRLVPHSQPVQLTLF